MKPVGGRTRARPEEDVSLPVSRKSVRKKRKAHKKTGSIRARHVPDTKRVKICITDNTKKCPPLAPDAKVIVRSNLALALLSPFRFPMLREERFIAGTARYAGVFFVLVGGFFSLLNLEYASGTIAGLVGIPHQAQVIDGAGGTALTTTTSGSGDATAYTISPNYTMTSASNPTPDVRIAVEGQGTLLVSMAIVMVNVPDASEVKLLAERKYDGAVVSLGAAFKIDPSTWRFYWDTKQYPDGEYRLRAVVRNQHGSYERSDTLWRMVDNVPETGSNQVAGGTSGETALLTAPDDAEEAPVLATTTNSGVSTSTSETAATTTAIASATLKVFGSFPLSGDVPMEVTAPNATEVKIHARHTGTGALYYAGSATKNRSGVWTLRWDSRKVPDGTYAFRARILTAGGTGVESPIVERTVKNGIVTQVIVSSTTAHVTETTTAAGQTPTTTAATFVPTIEVRVTKQSPVSGFTDVLVKTSPVMWAELYAVPKGSLTPRFLGLAQKVSDRDWVYTWQTTQSPNGNYELYARVKTEYGFTEGKRMPVTVLNEVVAQFTEDEEEAIGVLQSAGDELITVTEETPEETEKSEALSGDAAKVVYVEPVATFIAQVEAPEEEVEKIESVLTEFRKRLNAELNNLARAEREENEDELRRVKESIEDLRADVIRNLRTEVDRREILDRIDGYLAQVVNDLKEITLKNEAILRERVGEAIEKDSDKDGITDYDEVNLYRTNPFAADTDGDSYIDSVEIKLGYDPVSAKNETLSTYESPKEVGIIRDDILVVDAVTTLTPTEAEETGEAPAGPPRALISGKGLPNSFVTLYIFSTPIVVTVKTDAEGAWSYVFDKELDEGEHEVYVGITDNAGRIVAKSSPLPFVKTAVAFTEAEAVAVPVEASPEPSLIDERMLLLVASIAIAGLGLVLILLGLHVRGRQEPGAVIQTA